MTIPVSPSQFVETMMDATPNLFGTIKCRKEIFPHARKRDEAQAVLGGKRLFKEWSYAGMATLKNYGTAVNNAKERDGQERDFVPQPRKWGRYVEGSDIVIEHKGEFYINIRVHKNTTCKGRLVDEDGTERTFEECDSFLKEEDKPESGRKSREATAESQNLPVEDAVHPRDIKVTNIVELAYANERYILIPAPQGGVTAVSRDEDEERQEPATP